jgi:environmental stress-induced protein Ves
MIEHARHYPCADYTCMPWRNGAGTTREIARAPAQGEPFAWRLSLASLQASGPFSCYAGYQRCVALVDGRGFILHVADTNRKLVTRGDHVIFAGAAAACCELLDGPCTDLSLMVHETGTIDSVTRVEVGGEQRLDIQPHAFQVLFVLRGGLACGALTSAESCGHRFDLGTHDTLLLHGGGPWSISHASEGIAELLAITFRAL